MKRYIRANTTNENNIIRINNGEYFNDVALASEIANEIYESNRIDDADTLIEEAAKYYTSEEMQEARNHDYSKIVEKAKMFLDHQIESEEAERREQESAPKYEVYGFNDNYVETGHDTSYDSKVTEDPKTAIVTWFKLSQKYPTCTSIIAKNKEVAIELLEYANANEDLIRSLAAKYKCPYKVDYLVNAIREKAESGNLYGFYRNSRDQVYPFANG